MPRSSKKQEESVKGLKGRLRAILSSLFEFEDCGDALWFTTALLCPHGDYITVYIYELPEGGYKVSDNGKMLRQIELLGFDVPVEKTLDICNSFGVEITFEKLRSKAQSTLELAQSIIWTAQAASFLLGDSSREK